MYKISDLEGEILEKLDVLEALHPDQDIPASWIAQAVMADHGLRAEADPDGFHHCCSFRTVREYTRRVISQYDGKPTLTPDAQIVMPGYERLQTHYVVDRGGEQTMVRVDRLTSQERRNKAAELRAMGAGCYQHAEELDRYDAGARRHSADG
jgi:hypothetical protein